MGKTLGGLAWLSDMMDPSERETGRMGGVRMNRQGKGRRKEEEEVSRW